MANQTIDLIYTYRFLKILTTKWEDMDAFEHGIIDEKGKLLRKSRDLKTTEEKDSYTYFHRIVFNMKRLLNKLPGGESKIASYASALFLIREEKGISTDDAYDCMIEDMAANSVGSGNVDMNPTGKSRKFKSFNVPSDIFRRFDKGRNRFERWKKYLNLEDDNQKSIYNYAKRKPGNTIILRDETTGALRAIRRRANNER
jgi:hypothetical protein